MRALGHAVVDLLVEHSETLPDRPIAGRSDPAALRAAVDEPLPPGAEPWPVLLDRVRRDVLGNAVHQDHPRCFATVPTPGSFAGTMAVTLAAGLQLFAGTALEGAGAAEVERVTLRWLADACGMPPGTGGLFVSGGSLGNVHALAAARHARLGDRVEGGVAYCSDQTHSSVERAMRLLGFAPEQLRRLPSDDGYRLDVAALEAAVAEDRARGRRPFVVIANAGSTNTAAVDPLGAAAELCAREDLWLHVDGAYGAAMALSPRQRPRLDGLEHADSLTLDPHKLLFQPIGVGCLLVRDPNTLLRSFRLVPEYLEGQDVRSEDEFNFYDLGIELTRPFRALTLWMTVKLHGGDAIAQALDHGCAIAEHAERRIRDGDAWELETPAALGVVTFASRAAEGPERAVLHRSMAEHLLDSGLGMVTDTRLRERPVLRLCTPNPRSTREDVDAVLAALERASDVWSQTPRT